MHSPNPVENAPTASAPTVPPDPERIDVTGTPCVLTDLPRLTAALSDRARRRDGAPLSVDFTNVHIVALRSVDSEFRRVTDTVDWFVPDSQVLTWAVKLLGGRGNQRAYGPEFLDYFIRHAPADLTHYFLGGSSDCLERLLTNLRAIRPGLRIAGARNGYFPDSESAAVVRDISDANPDVLWVGLGTPRQQEWISRHKPELTAGAALAVGFAFDVNAGTKKDAPAWLGRLGLTWLYRLVREPRRLWKRYLYYNSVFVFQLSRQFFVAKRRNARSERTAE